MEEENKNLSTKDRILKATIDLMVIKGVKAVTTREIALESGFSEMTLFRHFGSKTGLLEAAVDRFYHRIDVTVILEKKVTYDLVTDLKLVSSTYHWYMKQNEQVVLLGFQERNTIPSIIESLTENPREFKTFLIKYFDEMERRGKIGKINKEIQAMNFMWLNLGFFFAKFIAGDKVAQMDEELFIDESAKVFAEGLAKKD